MADTTTPLLGLLLQGTGGNNNSWGTNLNDQVITPIENAIAGVTGISGLTGGTLTLTADQARCATIYLGGTLTSDLVIVVPDTNKVYRLSNGLAGSFFARVKCVTSANVVSLPAGGKFTTIITIDGIPYRQDRVEVGRYVYDVIAATADVLECNGAAYKRASLPDLFAKIGTTFGTTDSSDFKVPNAYDTGRFLRSRSASLAVATSQANQNKAHTHTGSGTTTGESVGHTHTGSGTTSGISIDHSHTQQGTFTSGNDSPDHTHSVGASQNPAGGYAPGSGPIPGFSGTAQNSGGASARHTHSVTISGQTGGISADHTHTYSFTTSNISVGHTHTYSFTTSSDGGTEARPESLVGILCIRY